MGNLVKIFLILERGRNLALDSIIRAHGEARHDYVGAQLTALFDVTFALSVQALPDIGPLQDDEDEDEGQGGQGGQGGRRSRRGQG